MDTLGNLLDKQLTAVMKRNVCNNDNDKIDNLSDQISRLTLEINVMANKFLDSKTDESDIIRPQHKTY